MDWHADFPPSSQEAWDMLAKALLLRFGGSVVIPEDEIRRAAETECEVALADDGTFHFRRRPT